MYKTTFVCLLLILTSAACFAQESWKLSTEQDGIKVYTRPMADSKLKALRVICELNASPAQLVAVLLDVDACPDWVYHTKSCRLLKQVSASELYYYSEVSVPWPVENRDFIAHIIISQNPATKVVTMDAPCVQGMVPVKSGIVRIAHSTGRWTITPEENNKIKIDYLLEADPGGSVPAWLTNLFITQGPLQSFKNLRRQLEKTKYQNARFAFITGN